MEDKLPMPTRQYSYHASSPTASPRRRSSLPWLQDRTTLIQAQASSSRSGPSQRAPPQESKASRIPVPDSRASRTPSWLGAVSEGVQRGGEERSGSERSTRVSTPVYHPVERSPTPLYRSPTSVYHSSAPLNRAATPNYRPSTPTYRHSAPIYRPPTPTYRSPTPIHPSSPPANRAPTPPYHPSTPTPPPPKPAISTHPPEPSHLPSPPSKADLTNPQTYHINSLLLFALLTLLPTTLYAVSQIRVPGVTRSIDPGRFFDWRNPQNRRMTYLILSSAVAVFLPLLLVPYWTATKHTDTNAEDDDDGEEDNPPITLPPLSASPRPSRHTNAGARYKTTKQRIWPTVLKWIILILAFTTFLFSFAVLVAHVLAVFVEGRVSRRLEGWREGVRGGEVRVCLCGR